MHGHSTAQDEADQDMEKFFRIIDKAIYEHHSKPTDLPLILAGLPEQLSVFHKVRKHNNNVLLEGITAHPDGLSVKELTKRAWAIIEPYLVRQSRDSCRRGRPYRDVVRGSRTADPRCGGPEDRNRRIRLAQSPGGR